MSGSRLDLDELARLEEERDFLLTSIADLDREHEAGDVDDADYRALRDGYVTRAAATLRSIEAGHDQLAERRTRPRSRGRLAAWVVVTAAFAGGAGVVMANALGARGTAQITGAGALPGEAESQCQSLSFQKPAEGVECYEEILADRPDDPEALTYQGWAKVRSDDIGGGMANFDRVVDLEPTFPDVYVFRSSVAKNAGDFAGAQRELETLYSLNPSRALLGTLEQMGLESEVAVGLLAPDIAACWADQQTALTAVDVATSASTEDFDRDQVADAFAELALAGKCLDDILEVRPTDSDALTLSSLAVGVLGVVDPSFVTTAERQASEALTARPDDPTALLLRSVWRNRLGDLDGATADLDQLGDRRVSPLIAPYAERSQIRADIENQRSEPRSPAPTSTAP